MDACHAGDEGGHAHQKETSDGVPNEGDEGDAAPGSEEVLDKGHIDWNGGSTRRRGSGGYDPNSENGEKLAMTRRRPDLIIIIINCGRDEYASKKHFFAKNLKGKASGVS